MNAPSQHTPTNGYGSNRFPSSQQVSESVTPLCTNRQSSAERRTPSACRGAATARPLRHFPTPALPRDVCVRAGSARSLYARRRAVQTGRAPHHFVQNGATTPFVEVRGLAQTARRVGLKYSPSPAVRPNQRVLNGPRDQLQPVVSTLHLPLPSANRRWDQQ